MWIRPQNHAARADASAAVPILCRDGAAAVAGCRGGEVAVWQIAGDRVASKPAVHRLGLPTSVCAVTASPVNAAEVSAWRQS